MLVKIQALFLRYLDGFHDQGYGQCLVQFHRYKALKSSCCFAASEANSIQVQNRRQLAFSRLVSQNLVLVCFS